jgi:hypothetical protein
MARTSSWLSSPIESAADADALLVTLGRGLYAIAALQAVFGAFLAWQSGSAAVFGDVVFWLVAGFLLPRTRSRILAVMVLLAALGVAATTFGARFGGGTGGKNIVLALLLVGVGVRAVIATVRYHRFQQSRVWWRNVAIFGALYGTAVAAVFVFGMIGMAISEAIGFEWSDAAAGVWLMWFNGLSVLIVYFIARRWLPLLRPQPATT